MHNLGRDVFIEAVAGGLTHLSPFDFLFPELLLYGFISSDIPLIPASLFFVSICLNLTIRWI